MRLRHACLGSLCVLPLAAATASAGMAAPLPDHDTVQRVLRLNQPPLARLQALSFFLLVLLCCALVVQFLWNRLGRDFPQLPRLPDFINTALPPGPLHDADGFGLSHYAANVWVMGPNRGLKLDEITDGTANTILVGEVNSSFRPWGHPVNWRDPAKGINRSPNGFGGAPGAGGANFVMADGSAKFVSEKVSPEVLKALATPEGGEDIDLAVLQPPR